MTISTQATIGSVRAKVDGSMSFTLNTPELSGEEKVAVMDLQNRVLECLLKPLDDPEASVIQVKEKKENLTPSQRLRNVIFVLHKQKTENGDYVEDFDTYYAKIMESIIQKVKDQLDG